MVTSPLFIGEFDPENFSPVKIQELVKPLDELSEAALRKLLIDLRLAVRREEDWQESVGLSDELRLIKIAEMYLEARNYYAQFNETFSQRISGPDYVPVLRLKGDIW